MTINDYFDKVLCINLDRRPDRWAHVQDQCRQHNLVLERFPGIDMGAWGNNGCTESHGAVLTLIVEHGWKRTLILEDDFEFRFPNSQQLFDEAIGELPQDWFMVYLGGGYGNEKNKRISPHIVRFNHMKTTSSYGVTLAAATEMHKLIRGIGPIDELYSYWHAKDPCYCVFPRLVVQYTNFSDLQKRVMDNQMSMEDRAHEEALGMFG